MLGTTAEIRQNRHRRIHLPNWRKSHRFFWCRSVSPRSVFVEIKENPGEFNKNRLEFNENGGKFNEKMGEFNENRWGFNKSIFFVN